MKKYFSFQEVLSFADAQRRRWINLSEFYRWRSERRWINLSEFYSFWFVDRRL